MFYDLKAGKIYHDFKRKAEDRVMRVKPETAPPDRRNTREEQT